MGKTKILHIIHGLNIGGAEKFIYNVFQLLGNVDFQFDFAIQNPVIRNTKFKELIQDMGGTIYLVPDFRKNPIGEFFALKKIMARGYDYIHIHNNALINPIPVIAAAQFPFKVIIHSHNTSCLGGKLGKLIHTVNTKTFLRKRFVNVACGNDAGKWMFGNKEFKVLNNAISLAHYRYNTDARKDIRSQYNLSDEFVIGQVGRLTEVKNQVFSLRLLREYINRYPEDKVKLMLVGEGDMIDQLKELSRNLGISENVVFSGAVNNINEYYSSFDCLILPSLYEGLAFVAVEAQGAGLKIIASDTNTKEIDITGEVTFNSLDDLDSWIKSIHNCHSSYNRLEISDKLAGTVYDDNALKRDMLELYKSTL